MSDITCPACGESIPGDSRYCDQCGAELLQCVGCGALGTDQFCPDCGRPMVARTPQAAPVRPIVDPAPVTPGPVPPGPDGGQTVGGRRKTLVLRSRRGGVELVPQDGAVIGRRDCPYEQQLSSFDLISRRHGRFTRCGREWYIEDLGSTNGTLVNDIELAPESPVRITAGDVVDIGTYIFDVIER